MSRYFKLQPTADPDWTLLEIYEDVYEGEYLVGTRLLTSYQVCTEDALKKIQARQKADKPWKFLRQCFRNKLFLLLLLTSILWTVYEFYYAF